MAVEQVGAGVLGLPQAMAYLTWGPGTVCLPSTEYLSSLTSSMSSEV